MARRSVRTHFKLVGVLGVAALLVVALLALPSAASAEAEIFFDKTASYPEDGCPGFPFIGIAEGENVLFCYEVYNFGDTSLLDVVVLDDNATENDLGDDFYVSLMGLTDEDGDGFDDDLGAGGFAYGEAVISGLTAGFYQSFAEAYGIDEESGDEMGEGSLVLIEVAAFVLGPCTPVPLGTANAFDLFILHNATHFDTDTEGRVGVGDDANLTNYGVGLQEPNSMGGRDDLVVGQNLTFTNGTVYHGNVVYGTSGNLTSVAILNGMASTGYPVDFPAAETYLLDSSDYWGGIPNYNGTVTYQPWGGIFLDGTDPEINVFNISGDALASTVYFQINAPAGSSVLVNVTPQSGTTNNVMQNFGFGIQGGVNRDSIVFHFPDTENLTMQGIGVQGTVLAPKAHLDFNNGSIDGILIGANLLGNGEVHNIGFAGCLPLPDNGE